MPASHAHSRLAVEKHRLVDALIIVVVGICATWLLLATIAVVTAAEAEAKGSSKCTSEACKNR